MTVVQGNLETAFEVIVNSDLTEGRGGDRLFGIYDNEASAHKGARGRDVSGTNGKVNPIQVITIDRKTYRLTEISVFSNEKEREYHEVLSRLSDHDRKVLGL